MKNWNPASTTTLTVIETPLEKCLLKCLYEFPEFNSISVHAGTVPIKNMKSPLKMHQ